VLGGGDEVGERVRLVLELAVLVPVAAELAAPAHVRDREHHPALEQAEPRRRERRVDRDLVRAVAVQQHRRGPVDRHTAPVHHRDRHAGAVGGRRPLARALVLVRVVAAEDGLALDHRQRSGGEVVVERRERGDERRVLEPQRARVELGVGPDAGRVDGIGHLDLPVGIVDEATDADLLEPGRSLRDHQMVGERVHPFQADVRPVREELDP
jgi:hypothetical protein